MSSQQHGRLKADAEVWTDEYLAEQLAIGPAGYVDPVAWRIIADEAAKRGVQAKSCGNTAREISRGYDAVDILFRRWAGAWIDFLAMLGILAVPDAVLGNELYQQTVLVWLALVLAYFPVTEGLYGRSLGKVVTGLAVVDETGRIPGIWKAIRRTIPRIIEVNPILLGGLPAGVIVLATRDHQRLGDMWSRTFVLHKRDLSRIEPTTHSATA